MRAKSRGWALSPAYDINPTSYGDGLSLNISDRENAQDLDLAREVASYFRIKAAAANKIIADIVSIVRQWREVASNLGIAAREQEFMERAFRVAEPEG